jgi:putative aldouronate transport system substrate-binding protein
LKKQGTGLTKLIPAKYLDATKINGKIYGIPNYQIMGMTKGFSVKKSLADKYKLDPAKIKSLADFEPLLAQIKKNETINPILVETTTNTFAFWDKTKPYFYDQVLNNLFVRSDDKTMKVVSQFDLKEYVDQAKLLHSWYNKGYFPKDIASIKDVRSEANSGNYALTPIGNMKPGNEAEVAASLGYPVVDVATTNAYVQTGSVLSTLNAISSTSKNPEKAMQLLNLINTDKDLYNLLCHGIEGTHYTKVDANTVKAIADGGYDPNTDWEFACQFNGYYREGQKPGIWEETIKVNESAAPSPIIGFVFDPTPVKTQVAQMTSTMSMYLPGLNTGTVDPAKAIPELQAKLKAAGQDKVIAEAQKQIDAWRKANGK